MKALYTFLVCILLTASVVIQPMDKKRKKQPKEEAPAFVLENWAIEAGNIILGSTNLEEELQRIINDKNFLKLPDINRAVISRSLYNCATAKSLNKVADAIRYLIISNLQLDKLINDPGFSLSLIKHYSKKFNINNETVSKIINTVGTRKRLDLQEYFVLRTCKSETLEPGILKELRSSNFDLNFTDENGHTPAQKCLLLGHVQALKIFLAAGVDPEPLLANALWLKEKAHIGTIDIIVSMLVNAVHEKKNTEEKQAMREQIEKEQRGDDEKSR